MSAWLCEICNASFERRGARPRRFCSVACRSANQRIGIPSVDDLKEMYVDKGMSANEIARLYGRDAKRVWEWLRDGSIPTRPRGTHPNSHFVKGAPSAFLGRSHTAENRARFRDMRLADGRVPYLVNGQHYLKGVVGPDHPNWQGGLTPERQAFYASAEWKGTAKAVWIRDSLTCQRCGCKPPRKGPKQHRGHVHHIVSFQVRELRTVMSNLVLLCADCHRWIHSRKNTEREYLG